VSSVEEVMHFSEQNATFSILLWNNDGTDLTLKVSCVKNITRFIFYWSQWGVYSDKYSGNFEHPGGYIPGVSKRSGTNRWTKAVDRLILMEKLFATARSSVPIRPNKHY